jgi:hypothetical protein
MIYFETWNIDRKKLDCSRFKSWYIENVILRYGVGITVDKECKKDIMDVRGFRRLNS